MTPRNALIMTIFWISLSGLFAGFLYSFYGVEVLFTYLSCYTVEKLLSFDNLLMFYVIFSFFKISPSDQKICLNVGIISSFILRASLIFPGAWLVQRFSWLNYGFAIFLIYSSIKVMLNSNDDESPEKIIGFVKRYLPSLSTMALVIAVIELTDLLFALDSIPVAFGITNNSLIIYSANLFAILGLRSMYFLLLAMIEKFIYLPAGISVILGYTGINMLLPEQYKISNFWFFVFIVMTILVTIGFSLRRSKL